jgi:hypothetical protein
MRPPAVPLLAFAALLHAPGAHADLRPQWELGLGAAHFSAESTALVESDD